VARWSTPQDRLDRSSRARLAEQAWQDLPSGGSGQATVHITCAHSHHLATVFDTPLGLVYRSQIRRHAHGDADLPDTPHGGTSAKAWFDLLDPEQDSDGQAGDQLPAWCDCGPRVLSRAAVLDWVAEHEHHVIVD
jgi:hypothetical protein